MTSPEGDDTRCKDINGFSKEEQTQALQITVLTIALRDKAIMYILYYQNAILQENIWLILSCRVSVMLCHVTSCFILKVYLPSVAIHFLLSQLSYCSFPPQGFSTCVLPLCIYSLHLPLFCARLLYFLLLTPVIPPHV